MLAFLCSSSCLFALFLCVVCCVLTLKVERERERGLTGGHEEEGTRGTNDKQESQIPQHGLQLSVR